MYNKKDILKSLNEYNYFIDEQVLGNLIKNWKVDPVYEDDDGVEYFDSLSIVKIKKGIKLKAQGFDNDQIIYHINKILEEKAQKEQENEEEQKEETVEKAEIVEQIPTNPQAAPTANQTNGMKAFTIDITSQTLQLLADAVANKITNSIKSEIKSQIQNSEVIKELFLSCNKEPDVELKKDNEALSRQVEELLDDNKQLAQRVELLEKKKNDQKKPSFFDYLKTYFK